MAKINIATLQEDIELYQQEKHNNIALIDRIITHMYSMVDNMNRLNNTWDELIVRKAELKNNPEAMKKARIEEKFANLETAMISIKNKYTKLNVICQDLIKANAELKQEINKRLEELNTIDPTLIYV